VEPNPDGA